MKSRRSIAISILLASILSCTFLPVSREEAPDIRAARPAPASGDPFPNWPHHPDETEMLFDSVEQPRSEISGRPGGTTGALKLTVKFPDIQKSIDFKWKSMIPPRWLDSLPYSTGALDGINNSPRKEIAAFEIQSLFLDPEDYVVPTSLPFCVPLVYYRQYFSRANPTLPDSNCVMGVLSLWLHDVTIPKPLLDNERFARDPAYAYYLANFNLLTYLVRHHDGREGNFLISTDEARPQLFAIDNGVAFGGIWYNWFVANWNSIRVPALRKESIDRLRKITEEDVHRELSVMVEMHRNDEGIFRLAPDGPNLDENRGVRIEGSTVQFGLTDKEIHDIWERIEDLIRDVDEGDIPTI